MGSEKYRRAIPPEMQRENSLWVRYVMRPISYQVTDLFALVGMSANQVTYLSMLMALVVFAFFLFPSRQATVTAAVLAQVWMLLDCVDGNLARTTGSGPHGEFVDTMAGYLFSGCAFLGCGIAAGREVVLGTAWIPGGVFPILGAVAAISTLTTRATYQKFVATELKMYRRPNPTLRIRYGWMFQVDKNVCGFFTPVLLIGSITGLLHLVVSFYALYFSSVLVYGWSYFIRRVERDSDGQREPVAGTGDP